MAAGPVKELETLLIRLAGDGSQYASMMKNAVMQSEKASAQIARQQQMIAQQAARAAIATQVAQEKAAISVKMAQEKAAISTQAAQQKAAISVERAQQRAADAAVRSAARQQQSMDKVSLSLMDYAKKIDHVSNKLQDMGRGMSFYVTAPIVSVGTAMVKLAADYEKQSLVFETLLGKEAGLPLLKNMQHLADVTPYLFKDISGAGQLLMGYGMEADKILDTVRMLGDVASGTGADLWRLANVYGQIMNMGHLKGQDRLQLTSNNFPIAEIAKTIGITMKQLPKLMEEGKISFSIIEQTFKRLTSEGGKFSNLMVKLNKTTVGVFSNFLDMIQKTGREMGKALLPAVNNVIEKLRDMFVSLQQLTPEATKFISSFALGLAGIGPILFGLGIVLKPIAAVATIISNLAVVLGGSAFIAFLSTAGTVLATILAIVAPLVIGIDFMLKASGGGGLISFFKDAAVWAGILKDEAEMAKEAVSDIEPITDWADVPEAAEFAGAIQRAIGGDYTTAAQRENIRLTKEEFEKMFDTVDTTGVAALKKFQEGMLLVNRAVEAGIITDEKKWESIKKLTDAYNEAVPNAFQKTLEAYQELQQQMDVDPVFAEFEKNKNVLYDAWMAGIIGAEEYSNRVNALFSEATGWLPDIEGWLSSFENKQMSQNEYARMLAGGLSQNEYGQMLSASGPPMGMSMAEMERMNMANWEPVQRVKRDEAGETSAGGLWGLMQSAGATQKTTEESMLDEQKKTNEMLQMLYEKSGSSW